MPGGVAKKEPQLRKVEPLEAHAGHWLPYMDLDLLKSRYQTPCGQGEKAELGPCLKLFRFRLACESE